jgi:hypothetical protein
VKHVIISDYLSDCKTENGLVGKVVGLCADNTNSNFGGAEKKGENSVLTKLQKNLGHGLKGVGCAGHIFHNTIRAAIDTVFTRMFGILLRVYYDVIGTV